MPFAIDANSSQLYFGEETTLGLQSPGPYYPVEANTYPDFGVDVKTVQRSPLNIARQQAKGTITEQDVAAGFQADFTQTNLARIMQGFVFADVAEKAATQPTNGTQVGISAVSATQFTLASAVAAFQPNHLILASNFASPLNVGVMLASAVAGAVITAAPVAGGATVVDRAPGAAAKLKAVGYRLSAAATITGLLVFPCTLTDTGGVDFTTLGLHAGEWLYIGDVGNVAAGSNYNFTGATSGLLLRGYARIAGITPTALTFDFTTFGGNGDASGATTAGVNIWFGNFLANQTTLQTIKRRSYTMQRYLGQGLGNANQLEIMLGCVADKFTLNIPLSNKITADMTFVGINAAYQNTAMVAGTLAAPYNEAAVNTSQDLVNSLITVNSTESTSLFAYASDGKFMIDNGATVARALASPSGFDVQLGDFKASMTASAYFADISAVQSVQRNADVGYTNIFAKRNPTTLLGEGFIFDIPLLTLGGGKLKLEKDKKIMLDITGAGAANVYGNTVSYTRYSYLPASALSGYTGL
jgi:hypothetical protein